MKALRWPAAILGLVLLGACARESKELPKLHGTQDSPQTAATIQPGEPKSAESPRPGPVVDVGESERSKTPQLSDEILPESQLDLATVEITLERTGCLGWCPDFTVVIEGSGRVRYSGRTYVKTLGDRQGQISAATVRELLDLFRQDKFYTLKNEYHDGWSDLPATFVMLRVGDRKKGVENSWLGSHADSSGNELPDWRIHEMLDALAASIDRAVGIEQWIGTEEERDRLFSQVGR